MRLIAIATADWHINNWRQHSSNYRRLSIGLQLITDFGKLAARKKVPILFAGDLFHNGKRLDNRVLESFINTFDKDFPKDVDFIAISGNHDMEEHNTLSNTSPSYIKALSKVLDSFICLDNTYKNIHKGVRLYGIPYYTKNKGFHEVFKGFELDPKYKNILMIHRNLAGAKTPAGFIVNTHEDPGTLKELSDKFDLVISGDIHRPDELYERVYMLGAPQHQNIGDAGCEMGYWEIYEDLSMKFISLSYPQFIYIDEGQAKPDNHNFYIERPVEELDESDKPIVNFNAKQSRAILATNYCKTINETDTARITLLTKLLIESE